MQPFIIMGKVMMLRLKKEILCERNEKIRALLFGVFTAI